MVSELRWVEHPIGAKWELRVTMPTTIGGYQDVDRIRDFKRTFDADDNLNQYQLVMPKARVIHLRGRNVWIAQVWGGIDRFGARKMVDIGEYRDLEEAEARCVAMVALGLST